MVCPKVHVMEVLRVNLKKLTSQYPNNTIVLWVRVEPRSKYACNTVLTSDNILHESLSYIIAFCVKALLSSGSYCPFGFVAPKTVVLVLSVVTSPAWKTEVIMLS